MKTNHEEILRKFDMETGLIGLENQKRLSNLRKILVEQYGEEGVKKVEDKIEQEAKESTGFISEAGKSGWLSERQP